ncbi:ATP-binding protein [Streptacidiphilus carbonis]|uniref:ATP-binding protein n=1 Tax=Streptacidiphilus carbonis TaxID=105422 RepID=UPI0005A5EBE4|nr:BTAD domain-containing putative transcriptional regulator [Streptacidiphilus carbonis]
MTVALVLLPRVCFRGRAIGGARLHALLALLAADLRAGCGSAGLVEGIWPDQQPANPAKALQVLVSRARAQLGPGAIVGTPLGYRLALDEDQVDTSAALLRSAASARHAADGDHAAALAHAEAGLALWEGAGAATADVRAGDALSALRAARASTFRSLSRARALSLSRLDRAAEAVEPLGELIRARPRDEEVLAELLRCEAATVGPSAALARYDAYRRALRDELGSDPGPALQGLHRQLLQGGRPALRHGVPHEPNALVGREDDLAAVAGLLRSSRVTSIVGAGGLGKTRLAQAVARRAAQRAVHLVPLAGVSTDDGVAAEVASALGVGEAGPGAGGHPVARPVGRTADVLTGIVQALGPGPALLVLDNCEQVLPGVAGLVRDLVSLSGELRVLTTSRAPLGLSSESVYLLPELSLPTAVELFRQRARAARPGVLLPVDGVRELCGRLDGLPLAVELAAARVRVLSVAEIARRLEDRFALLRGGARDAPARHRTLHAVIDWSWSLLDPAAQAAMRALSFFPGGFTADAARHLLGGADAADDTDMLGILERLVDQSLLKVADTPSGARFRMLETVREFSAARRGEAGGNDRVADRFLAWARGFGLARHESVYGPDLVGAVRLIRAEQDNLLLALRLGLDREDGGTVAACSALLGGLWTAEANFARMATLGGETARVLSHFRPGPDFVEVVRTAAVLAAISAFLLQLPGAARSLTTLRRLPAARPDTLVRAMELVMRALTGAPGSEPAVLRELSGSDAPLLAATAEYVAGYVHEHDNDLDAALAAARRMLVAFDRSGSPSLWLLAHSRVGELCLLLDLGKEARHHLGEVLPVVEEVGARSSAVRVRWALVGANLQLGAVDEAEYWLEQAVDSGGDEAGGLPMFDSGVRAEILLARGEAEAGLQLWRRAAERLRSGGSGLPIGGRRPELDRYGLEIQAVSVIAHAQHGRLDLAGPFVGELPGTLSRLVARPPAEPGAPYSDLPFCGVLLLALAVVDLAGPPGPGVNGTAVRMIALAERLRFSRSFQPTMSAARARQTAEQADRPAYADAVSEYAGLGPDALWAAVAAALLTRSQLTAAGPA